MPSERGQQKRVHILISFTENSRKRKLICHGIKQISGCLGMGKNGEGHEGRITKGHKETCSLF